MASVYCQRVGGPRGAAQFFGAPYKTFGVTRLVTQPPRHIIKHTSLFVEVTDDVRSVEVSGYLCTLTNAGLVGIESSRNIYVPTLLSLRIDDCYHLWLVVDVWGGEHHGFSSQM